MKFLVRKNNLNMADSYEQAFEGRPTVLDGINITFGRNDTINVNSVDYASFSVENNTANKGIVLGDKIEIGVIVPTGYQTQQLEITYAYIDNEIVITNNFQSLPSLENISQYQTINDGDKLTYSINYTASDYVQVYTQIVRVNYKGEKYYYPKTLTLSGEEISIDFSGINDGENVFYTRVELDYYKSKLKYLSQPVKQMLVSLKDFTYSQINLEESFFSIRKTTQSEYVRLFDGYVDNIRINPYKNSDISEISCVSNYSRLQATMLGDKPFSRQTVRERLDIIEQLTENEYIFITPPDVNNVILCSQDVDNTSVSMLVEEIAKSTDTIIRNIQDNTFYFESLDNRPAPKTIYLDKASNEYNIRENVENAIKLSSNNIYNTINAVITNANNATIVKTSWVEETINPVNNEKEKTEHYYKLVNSNLLHLLGAKTLTVSTVLGEKTQAIHLANKIMARQSSTPVYENVEIDLKTIKNLSTFLQVLSPLTRNGKYVSINNIPSVLSNNNTINGYLEGANLLLEKQNIKMNAFINTLTYGKSNVKIRHFPNTKINQLNQLKIKDFYNANIEQK